LLSGSALRRCALVRGLALSRPGRAEDATVVRSCAVEGKVLLQQVCRHQAALRDVPGMQRAHVSRGERAIPEADFADGGLEEALLIAGADAQRGVAATWHDPELGRIGMARAWIASGVAVAVFEFAILVDGGTLAIGRAGDVQPLAGGNGLLKIAAYALAA